MEPVAIRPDQKFIWHGPSLFVFDTQGSVDGTDPMGGFWFRETRYLRALELRFNGFAPWVSAAGRTSQSEALLNLVYPETLPPGELDQSGGGTGVANDAMPRDVRGIPWRALEGMLRYQLSYCQLAAELTLTNRSAETVGLELTWNLAADYIDLFDANDTRGPLAPTDILTHDASFGVIRLSHRHPELPFETIVKAGGPAPFQLTDSGFGTQLSLASQETVRVGLLITAKDTEALPVETAIQERVDQVRAWRRRITRVSAPGRPAVVDGVNQAMDDLGSLALLEGEPDEWLAPAAGMPLYPGLWGRDAITATWQSSLLDQGTQLDAALTRLGRLQGTRVDPSRDEEPGRIVHSVRRGPLARLQQNPYRRYFADDASPFMFVIGLAQLYAWTGREDVLERHWDAALAVLDWAEKYGDRDGDGYIEYFTHAPAGPKNQGWKDSGDGIIDEHGALIEPPIAACEIQGYWFAALQVFAGLCVARGKATDARDYWRASQDLKTRFNRDWWIPEENWFGLALGRDKRLSRTVTSNPGHCLAAGIVSQEHVPPMVGRLFQSDLWSGWGIRTLSSRHPSYNPVGYHLGSVWTVENATIALGLRRYGFDARAIDLAGAIYDLAGTYDHYRAPECVGGYARTAWPHPGAYPRANPLQAWNQSAMVMLLQVILGLEPVAPLDLLVIDPVLPSWLPEVTLENLRVGGATVTLRFWRDSHFRSHGEIVRKQGTLKLVRQPPPESLTTSPRERVSRLVDGLVHA